MNPAVAQEVHAAVAGSAVATAPATLGTVTAGDVRLVIEIGDDAAQAPFDVRWTIESEALSRLVIARSLPQSGRLDYGAARLLLALPLILAFHGHGTPGLGTIDLRLEDYSDEPGISFCSSRDDAVLVPDTEYMRTHGYADYRAAVARSSPAWPDRAPTAFWRGSTTGLIWKVAGWADLPRLRLCAIARTRPDLFDVGISGVVQIEAHADEIVAAGYLSPPVPADEWAAYRYQIDVDGNSNAWAGYFQRLLTGSPVLKVASPFGFRQWFYRHMEPWRHYVPVAADMSDLIEKIEWLNANQPAARLIGEAGRQFALSLTYENEMRLAVLGIAAALRTG